LIGALVNNGIGMAGVARNVRILPVRVLGKCGGLDSDILAGMRWAAGLNVPGLPMNPNPARVLNMSLGGDGLCSAAYSDAISQVKATGAIVVVAAGNASGTPWARQPIAQVSLPSRVCAQWHKGWLFEHWTRSRHQRARWLTASTPAPLIHACIRS
jgi:subtilisin family serine protease